MYPLSSRPAGISGGLVNSPGERDHIGPEFTVRDALRLPVVRGGDPEVVAGHAQLTNAIRWVHAVEMPIIADALLGGELVLTTGLSLPAEDSSQRLLMAELASREIAALAIELGSTWLDAPLALVDAARQHGVPLIVFHTPLLFVAVSEEIQTRIVHQRYAVMNRVQEIENDLFDLLIGGGSALNLVERLAEVVNNPVGVVNTEGQLELCANPGRLSRNAVADWPTVNLPELSGLTASPIPKTARRFSGGMLMAVSRGAVLPDFTRPLLDRAGRLLAMTQTPELRPNRLEYEKLELFNELSLHDISLERARPRLMKLGFAGHLNAVMPVSVAAARTAYLTADEWTSCAFAVSRRWSDSSGILVTAAGTGIRALLVIPAGSTQQAVADEFARQIHETIGRESAQVSIVVGRATDWEGLGSELRRVEEARAVVPAGTAPWWNISRLELNRLLMRGLEPTRAEDFVTRTLGPLVGEQSEKHKHLLHTLTTLCSVSGNKSETARLMHLNRQSLYSRLARLGELLDTDLDDPETILAMQIAVRLHQGLALSPRR